MDYRSYSPTEAKRDFFNLISKVNRDHTPIIIESPTNKNESAVLISKSDWNALQETLYLESQGVGKIVRQREADHSGFTNINDIDWYEQ